MRTRVLTLLFLTLVLRPSGHWGDVPWPTSPIPTQEQGESGGTGGAGRRGGREGTRRRRWGKCLARGGDLCTLCW